jgi:hypothetical protein
MVLSTFKILALELSKIVFKILGRNLKSYGAPDFLKIFLSSHHGLSSANLENIFKERLYLNFAAFQTR